MNYYEHHIGDFLKKTAHLTLVEEGVYRRMLDRYYTTEEALPVEVRECCKVARASSRTEREAVAAVLKEFFVLTEDGHHQKRADEEIARYKDKQAKAKRSAEARWNAQPSQSDGNANAYADASPNAMRTHSEGNAPRARPQTPDSIHQRKEEAELPLSFALPDWIPTEAWDGYVAMRKKQRKPMTDRARDLKIAELQRFRDEGYDLGAILDKSTANCWTDIYAPRDGGAAPAISGGGNRV